jgi:DNA polymerase delta subunit 1
MYAAWFDKKIVAEEQKRIELAGEEDALFEEFEGLNVANDEDNNVSAVKPNDISSGNYFGDRERVWKRLLPNSKLTNSDNFIFQHVDTTQGIHDGGVPGIHLWGCTPEGQSVAVITKSFRPYFYARISNQADAIHVKEKLEYLLNPYYREDKSPNKVLSVEFVSKLSVCGWAEDRPPEAMVKITMADCSGIHKARKALDYGNRFVVPRNVPIQTFEANVQFELRYMVDHKMGGCQWIQLEAQKFSTIPLGDLRRLSNADYEINVESQDCIKCIPTKDKGDIAPLRILSFDIECKKTNGNVAGFVKAETDPVICVCVELQVYGKGTIHRAAFCYVENRNQRVEPIPHDASKGELPVDLFVFYREIDMMLALIQYFRESDPDAFTGWNISKFDFPYLFKRAVALGISDEFVRFTRMMGSKARIREVVVQSKAFGMKKMCETTCEGRFIYDALDFMTFGQLEKFRNYTLNYMSKKLLGDEKVDVHYTQIKRLHEGSDKDRSRLIYYCCIDAKLPLKILDARMGLVNGIEQARVTGVPIRWILGGQGRKTFSNILRHKRPYEVVPTRSPKMNNVFTKGGLVRKPIVGYYTTPIGTLDFNSLYPSIMQAYNICYSTVTSAQRAKELIRMGKYKREDFEWPPGFENDFCFVGPHIRLGILPDLLTQLLAQRAYVKGLQKKLDKTKPEEKALWEVLENRQLALKLCCNSVYGFLKAFILVDPRLMSAVTAWGQDMIKKTAEIVETHYKDNEIVDRKACEQMGIDYENVPPEGEPDPRPKMKYTPRIIYGDT